MDHADGVDWGIALNWVSLLRNTSRDEEDYELEVGPAGLGQPFKGYHNNIITL